MDERFGVRRVETKKGPRYSIVQRTEDLRDGRFVLRVRDEIKARMDQLRAQLDAMPRQKEAMETDLAQLGKRLAILEAHTRGIEEEIAKEEAAKKAGKEKSQAEAKPGG